MNVAMTGITNTVLAGAVTSGLLYHMARAYDDGETEYTPYESLRSMVTTEYIEAQPNKGYFARMDGVKTVSFTGSSIDRLSKLVSRRSPFGICFERRIIDPLDTDIRPVHYLSQAEIDRIRNDGVYPEGLSAEDRHWVDLDEPGKYAFSWEEEWRKLDDLMFDHGSVVFLIVPTAYISAELFAMGHPIIPAKAIWDPLPHLQRVAELVQLARERAEEGEEVDETKVEEGYLVWLSHKYQELYDGLFYPKIRAEMHRDIEQEIFTDSGEISDPDGELNDYEAAMFDLENQLDEIFEDGE